MRQPACGQRSVGRGKSLWRKQAIYVDVEWSLEPTQVDMWLDREQSVSTEMGWEFYVLGVIIVQYYMVLSFFLSDCSEKTGRLHEVRS